MSDVRLRYSGLVRFLAVIFSLITGLVFTTLITRNLSIVEYGQWNAIGSLIIYGTFPAIGLGYWFTRYTARNISVASTGILFSFIFSLGGIIAFFIAARSYITEFEILLPILIVAAIQVVTTSLLNSLTAIANGRNPALTGYAMIGFEIAKVIFILIAVYVIDFKLVDAIIVLILAQIVQIIIFVILLRHEFLQKVEFTNIKKIIKTLWIPFYSRLPGLIFASDILIVTFVTSSFPQIAIFRIALVFSTIIEYGSQLVYPLYIKLLGGGKGEDVLISTKLLLMFTIPMSVGIFILAKPLLFVLNPEYVVSEVILQILVAYGFSMVISTIFDNIILGMEKVDVMKNVKHIQLVHSGLFKLPTINLIRIGSYIITLTIFTVLFWSDNTSLERFGETWAIILLITNIPITLYKFKVARQFLHFDFPWKNISKYILSSFVMAILISFLIQFLILDPKLTVFVPQLFGIILAGLLTYFGILIAIDREAKTLMKNAIELMKRQ